MASFKFSLETVLEHRGRLERDAMLEYQRCAAAAEAVRLELEALNLKHTQEMQAARDQQASGVIDLPYLLAFRRYSASLKLQATELMSKWTELKATADNAHQRLVETSRDRQVLAKLREKRLAAWRMEQGRLEQADLDDVSQRLSTGND